MAKDDTILKFETKEQRRIREIDEQLDKIGDEYMVNCARSQLRFANSSKVTQQEKDLFFEKFCSDITEMSELKEEKNKLLKEQGLELK